MEEIRGMRRELNTLAPLQQQIRRIRFPALRKMAQWQTIPILRQARNGLAHGGQVLTDVVAIEAEQDATGNKSSGLGF